MYIVFSDHYRDKFTNPAWPQPDLDSFKKEMGEKYDELKKTVEEMKELLIKEKLYDERNNEPDCPMEEKVELIKRVARMVGVDLDEVYASHKVEVRPTGPAGGVYDTVGSPDSVSSVRTLSAGLSNWGRAK